MTTYTFKCSKCEHVFDESIPMHEYAVIEKKKLKFKCPSCNKLMNPKRVIASPVSVVFNGEGFYVNDSKKIGKSEDVSPS